MIISPQSGPLYRSNFASLWSREVAHLAVVGRDAHDRTDLVHALLTGVSDMPVTRVVISAAAHQKTFPMSTSIIGAEDAEIVLQQHLAELHSRYTIIEHDEGIVLDPIVIVIDSLDQLLQRIEHDQQRMHRLQLEVEAIAILGKKVRIHLIFSDEEMPYLAAQARGDLGTIVLSTTHPSLPRLAPGAAWYFAPQSTSARPVQFSAAPFEASS